MQSFLIFLNQNQGVIAFVALLLTVIGIYLSSGKYELYKHKKKKHLLFQKRIEKEIIPEAIAKLEKFDDDHLLMKVHNPHMKFSIQQTARDNSVLSFHGYLIEKSIYNSSEIPSEEEFLLYLKENNIVTKDSHLSIIKNSDLSFSEARLKLKLTEEYWTKIENAACN